MLWTGNGLKIGDLNARLPIIQGGMGIGISLSGLAAAVADAGGVGVISAAGIGMTEKDYAGNFVESNIRALKSEIRKAREKTKGVLGVNIMVAMSNFTEMVKAAIEEKIDIIFAGAGLPLSLPSFIGPDARTKIVPIVSSARAAALISKRWFEKFKYAPDAIVVEGPLAGGHLGFSEEQIKDPEIRLEKIVADTIFAIRETEEKSGKTIPVIAAGGIYSGADIFQFMKLGASGVQMATRFVTTVECDASDGFKQTYIDCREDDIRIIESPVGLPGRAIVNDFLIDVESGKKRPPKCPYHCIITCKEESSPYCISLALMNAKRGRMKSGFAFAGANAYRAEEITSVQEVMETLASEYNEAAATASADAGK